MKDYALTRPETTSRRIFTISAPAADTKRSLQIKTVLVPVDFSQESLRVWNIRHSLLRALAQQLT